MEIRYSNEKDIQDIMKLISQAQLYFKSHSIDQWQNGYPLDKDIYNDISKGHSYVLCDYQRIIGTMYFAIEDDINYSYIDGQWQTYNQTYAVIHRIVVDEEYKGKNIAGILLDYAEEECRKHHVKSIRIDTHKENFSMQRFLYKNDFVLCGEIDLQSGAKRIAFEKVLV